ncbi:EamA family transporter [uncultured Odoribacter sp.]|uniref:EamA family transporter n=1 Tax=uncultured Odoribacter sp. TaxID=876416 RepID=UPI0026181F15|nr:EamA family transporter [uncultured Odoribacter sp.]
MWKLILLSTIQSLFLVLAQVFLKFALARMGNFQLCRTYFRDLLVNWQLACSGGSIVIATLLWMYILRHFEFSMAYPMISISYIFGMLVAVFVFQETVPLTRWIGVILIMIGVILVAKH